MSDAVLIALIGSAATVVTGIGVAYVNKRLGKIHKQINSRMDELLELTRASGRAEGNKEGRAEQKQETKTQT